MIDSTHALTGKTIMITGATAGIGAATAFDLARKGAEVVIVSRDPDKCRAMADQIRRETDNPSVGFIPADLSSQDQIRQLVDVFKANYDSLDVLVNNAGAFFTNRKLSADGIEMTFALNHLSYFLLTNLLLDVLRNSPSARVVNVSSNAHFDSALDFDDLQLARGYTPFKAYGRSKFANVLFTYELARSLEGSGVTANVLHPGLVQTNIGKSASWWLGLAWRLLIPLRRGLTPEQGAQTSIYLASSSDVEQITGKYFVNQKMKPSDPATYDPESAHQLWKISAQMVGME